MTLDAIPLWGVFTGTILVVIISLEVGYRLGQIAHRRSEDEKESPTSAVAGAVLGLVAFMLAFTFSIASGRYDARKELVREEANAIRTAYQRADFLPEADRAEAKGTLAKYLGARISFAQSGKASAANIDEVLSQVVRNQRGLWAMAVANARQDMNSDVAALYIESLNDVFNVHALRLAVGYQTRIPIGIWVVLFSLVVLGMMGIGYHTGIAGSKRTSATLILTLSFALVITVIASLDRPSGFIQVTQQPLIDLYDSMAAGD